MRRPSNITFIVCAILFILAMIIWIARGATNFPPGALPIDPQARAVLPDETHASFRIDWVWPPKIDQYGPIPIPDVATNFTFLVFSSPLLSNPEWKLKYTFPATWLKPRSNYWETNIWEDVTNSSYFQIVVTNILNLTTSTTTSIPSPTAISMLLATPSTISNHITKNK